MSILTEKVTIKIDGKIFEDYDFSDVQLVQELQRPNTLRFTMQKRTLLATADEIRFSLSEKLLGKKVEFSVDSLMFNQNREVEKDNLKFTGIIFNANLTRRNLKAGAVIEVIAYSPDYLLYDNPHCISYEKKKLKEIVTETVKPYEIDIINDPRLEEEIPYTVQYNENNYAFLNRLASRYGEWFYYNGEKLVFGKLPQGETIPMSLGSDLLNYQYQLDMAHLNFVHADHNYLDYKNPFAISHYDPKTAKHNMTGIVCDQSNSLYQKETFQHLQASAPEDSFMEIGVSIYVQSEGRKAQMMICTGESNHADVKIGTIIQIKENYEKEQNNNNKDNNSNNEETCSHDDLLVCRVVHYVDNMGNYENSFAAIPAKCIIPPYTYGDFFPRTEPQRAVVKDNKDPEKLGRIRVQFLWQKRHNEEMWTPWIRIAQPYGGDNKGFYFIPEIEEEVMVGFENGNAEKPYVIGTLFHGEQKPMPPKKDNSDRYYDNNCLKYIKSKHGHTLAFQDDTDGKNSAIFLMDHPDCNYRIIGNKDRKLIELLSKGDIKIVAEGNILLQAGKNIVMKADEENIFREAKKDFLDTAHGNIRIKTEGEMHTVVEKDCFRTVKGEDHIVVKKDQNVDVKGSKEEAISGKYKLGASDIEEKAQNSMKLSSVQHEQKASGQMKIDGGPMLDAKGSMVKIN